MLTLKILSENGLDEALYGVGLSYGLTSNISFKEFAENKSSHWELWERLNEVSKKLAGKSEGHDKFLRMITVYAQIKAPLFWWKQFDTYKVGTVAQSESTMHTLKKNPLTLDDFAVSSPAPVDFEKYVQFLEKVRLAEDFHTLNESLPQSYYQTRIVLMNYEVLRNIKKQRKGHKLKEWAQFIEQIDEQAVLKEYLK